MSAKRLIDRLCEAKPSRALASTFMDRMAKRWGGKLRKTPAEHEYVYDFKNEPNAAYFVDCMKSDAGSKFDSVGRDGTTVVVNFDVMKWLSSHGIAK